MISQKRLHFADPKKLALENRFNSIKLNDNAALRARNKIAINSLSSSPASELSLKARHQQQFNGDDNFNCRFF